MSYIVEPIRAFKDNYIWHLINSKTNRSIIVDPGDPQCVLNHLQNSAITPQAILITHHHADHCGGAAILQDKFQIPIFAPAHEQKPIASVSHYLQEGENIKDYGVPFDFEVIDIPGHTAGHIAFYGLEMIFCGDTLFGAGCGRLFEGTVQQMVRSLNKIISRSRETKIFCGHEYTLNNLRFAAEVEPNNTLIAQRVAIEQQKIENYKPTLPSTIALEIETNPFLRCHEVEVIEHVSQYAQKTLHDPVEVFFHLREWKNNF